MTYIKLTAWLIGLLTSCIMTGVLFAHAAYTDIVMLEGLSGPVSFVGALVCFVIYALLIIKLPRV
jgi:hypothetical protein